MTIVRFPREIATGLALASALAAAACSPSSLVDAKPPIDIVDPGQANSYQGAIALRNTAITQFAGVFDGFGQSTANDSYVVMSGQFTDEFQPNFTILPLGADARYEKSRGFSTTLENPGASLYTSLQFVRMSAQNGRGMLAKYAPSEPAAWRGRLAALEGYTELFLSELYCSGIPLSTIPTDADVQYGPGLTTAQLNEHAAALFDTAATLASDSARIARLARIGRGRALLNLGRYADAASAVSAVPTSYVYTTDHTTAVSGNGALTNFLGYDPTRVAVTEREGGNGLDWVSANDPRVVLLTSGGVRLQQKYTNASASTVLASGIEARLIEAESDLQAGGTAWLGILNALRTSCTTTPCATPAPAGTGGVAGLPLLGDPGLSALPPGKTAADARVDLLFRERAFWLFATGHRQGDLRRLLRQYHRLESATYPTGPYTNFTAYGLIPSYGTAVVLVPSDAERSSNPLYSGCFNLDP